VTGLADPALPGRRGLGLLNGQHVTLLPAIGQPVKRLAGANNRAGGWRKLKASGQKPSAR
jgi:hypothetical protein